MNRMQFLEDTISMLNEQGCYAFQDGCKYKTANGKKCAIGLHIPDELYRASMGGTVGTLFYEYPSVKVHLENKYGAIVGGDIEFLAQVQLVHDDRAVGRLPLPTLEQAKFQLANFLV